MYKCKLYVLNEQCQLQSYENDKLNICGWYNDIESGSKDAARAASVDGRQFVLIENGVIVLVARGSCVRFMSW